ncbi:hypothetical protein CPB84DRAFT_227697 [Gymnopilus junonius]|uniref:Uncharacterized protein n=1 Tax=Gymnopilus junonius TaxID=109634 RepID=A0A9P5NGE0_GYMJU|nr:hypothetical protein CPB84DRAFT_227697 [Gymnopilus junonius]
MSYAYTATSLIAVILYASLGAVFYSMTIDFISRGENLANGQDISHAPSSGFPEAVRLFHQSPARACKSLGVIGG